MIQVEYNNLDDFRHAPDHAPELFAVAEALVTALLISALGKDDGRQPHILRQHKTGNNSWSLITNWGAEFHFRFRRDYSAIDVFRTWFHHEDPPLASFTTQEEARKWVYSREWTHATLTRMSAA